MPDHTPRPVDHKGDSTNPHAQLINFVDSDGNTALSKAVSEGNLAEAQRLLAEGASACPSVGGLFPHPLTASELTQQQRNASWPILSALSDGRMWPVVPALLSRMEEADVPVNAWADQALAKMANASHIPWKGSVSVLMALRAHGAIYPAENDICSQHAKPHPVLQPEDHVRARAPAEGDELTPDYALMFRLARVDDVEGVEWLLERGLNVKARDEEGRNLLQVALAGGEAKLIRQWAGGAHPWMVAEVGGAAAAGITDGVGDRVCARKRGCVGEEESKAGAGTQRLR